MRNSQKKAGRDTGPITIALAGNPNAGKTTIFNALTGARQRVGNYPGVTVEKIEGTFRHRDREVNVTDLPGTYSLAATSLDELVARNYVMDERPDVVVSIVDASNLERNLYLAVQFMEMGVPLVLVFNKTDLAEARGMTVDTRLLSELFRCRIVKTVAHERLGLEQLKDAVVETALADPPAQPVQVRYGRELEGEIELLEPRVRECEALRSRQGSRWVAVKLLERDEEVRKLAAHCEDGDAILQAAEEGAERIHLHFGDRPEIVVADKRYGFISGACQEAVRNSVEIRHTMSDRIDGVVTSRFFGIPIFFVLMYALFKFTFTFAAPPMAWIEAGQGGLASVVTNGWPEGWPMALRSLLVDGLIGGVGGVLVFFPNILLLFAGIAFLEDSGYMARGAFIMDGFMHRIGLHGRSFIPMMVGFGCTVPAILATRTLGSRRDRLTTMLVLPLISCGARFPIYSLFAAAFFPPEWRARILMTMYLIGIALAVILAKALRVLVFKGETDPLVMELPPYRMPTVRGIWTHTWERGWMFLRKAGTVILAASIILWFLTNYPKPDKALLADAGPNEARRIELSTSLAGRVGRSLEPVMRHVGFDWRTTTALLGAFAAKEIFVAQLGIVYSLGDVDHTSGTLRETLQREYTRLQAFCIMLFCLISTPCIATLAATRGESGRWRYALLQFGGLTLLAYGVTLAAYQVGSFFGLGT